METTTTATTTPTKRNMQYWIDVVESTKVVDKMPQGKIADLLAALSTHMNITFEEAERRFQFLIDEKVIDIAGDTYKISDRELKAIEKGEKQKKFLLEQQRGPWLHKCIICGADEKTIRFEARLKKVIFIRCMACNGWFTEEKYDGEHHIMISAKEIFQDINIAKQCDSVEDFHEKMEDNVYFTPEISRRLNVLQSEKFINITNNKITIFRRRGFNFKVQHPLFDY